MGGDLVGRAGREEPPVGQHEDLVGQVEHQPEVVLDQQHGGAGIANRPQDGGQVVEIALVEP